MNILVTIVYTMDVFFESSLIFVIGWSWLSLPAFFSKFLIIA